MASRKAAREAREIAKQQIRELGGDVVSVGLVGKDGDFEVSVGVLEPIPERVEFAFSQSQPFEVGDGVPVRLTRVASRPVAT